FSRQTSRAQAALARPDTIRAEHTIRRRLIVASPFSWPCRPSPEPRWQFGSLCRRGVRSDRTMFDRGSAPTRWVRRVTTPSPCARSEGRLAAQATGACNGSAPSPRRLRDTGGLLAPSHCQRARRGDQTSRTDQAADVILGAYASIAADGYRVAPGLKRGSM